MKLKIANLLALPLLMAGMAFADTGTDGTVVYPYASDAFKIYNEGGVDGHNGWDGQNWIPANMLTLKVSAGTSIYLTHKVSNWLNVPNIGDALTDEGYYDMGEGKYGYVIAQHVADDKVIPTTKADGKTIDIHYANGETKDITYVNPNPPYEYPSQFDSVTTKGYLLGNFYEDTEIFFVMTPVDFNTKTVVGEVNSYDPVNDPDGEKSYESILASRQINLSKYNGDHFGNVVVDFGTTPIIEGTNTSHEFVIASVAAPPPSGQPLPGMLLCGMLCFGTATAASKMRKRSSK